MRPPRLESCYFGPNADDRWVRMARVLTFTAAVHCPNWQINVARVAPQIPKADRAQYARNTAKLDVWCEVVRQSADGDRLLLIDADTFFVRSIDDIWDRDFDFAYTTKQHMFPFNGGVVFMRVSPQVKAFIAAWGVENRRLVEEPYVMGTWRRTHGGINQAALGRLLETDHGLNVLEIPCREWNCEESAWESFDPNVTRIVHVKSALQLACVESQPVPPELMSLTRLWKQLERQATQAMSVAG